MRGRARSGCGGSSSWSATAPATGSRAGITCAATRGPRSATAPASRSRDRAAPGRRLLGIVSLPARAVAPQVAFDVFVHVGRVEPVELHLGQGRLDVPAVELHPED